jgi:hypothetical protein
MCWPESPSTLSSDTRRQLWLHDNKRRENRLRHLATRQDLPRRKLPYRNTRTSDIEDVALAEIMDYLTDTYGPEFIEKLIKHLPHLRPH